MYSRVRVCTEIWGDAVETDHHNSLKRRVGTSAVVMMQNKPDGVRDGVDCCAHDLIMVHSYKSDAYDSIIRWLEYEHFERAHQAVYKDLIQTAQQLQLARAATG